MNKTFKKSSPAVGSFAKGGIRRTAQMNTLLRKAGSALAAYPSLLKGYPEKAVTLADVPSFGGNRKSPRGANKAAAALNGFAGIFPAALAKGFRSRKSDEPLAYHLTYDAPPLVC